jgi:hypothetical protein
MNAETVQQAPGVLGPPLLRGTTSVAAICMVLVLLAPAILNGFPFVYADTGGYLERPFTGTLELGRSAFYGAFLAPGIPFDFWPNVVVQAALTAFVLLLTLRTHGLGDRPALAVFIAIALAALTGLPWYVGQLMPDILMSLSVLALHLLAFRHQSLHPVERAVLIVFIVAAIASHMATLGLACLIVLAFVVLRPLGPCLGLPRPRLRLPALALASGLLVAPLSNLLIAGTFAFTPGGPSFAFGRLLQDGIVARYLDDRCPDPTLRLCTVRHALPPTADEWLWNYDGGVHRLGGWREFEPEARRVIRETLIAYPGMHLVTALTATAEQFVTLKAGDGIRSRDNHHALGVLERLAPNVVPRFAASGQQHDAFDFTALNAIQVPLALACTILLALVIPLPRRLVPRSTKALAFTVLLALIANAAICGALANPNDRYQNRLAWLAPFATLVAALRLRAHPVRPAAAAPLP